MHDIEANEVVSMVYTVVEDIWEGIPIALVIEGFFVSVKVEGISRDDWGNSINDIVVVSSEVKDRVEKIEV